MLFTKIKEILTLSILICTGMLIFTLAIAAQDIEVQIKSVESSRVLIEGRFTDKSPAEKTFAFLQNYADVADLDSRIENLKVLNEKNEEIEYRKILQGGFNLNQIPFSWKYDVRIGIPQNITDAAHVSWFSEAHGLLMLNDLLPQFSANKKTFSAKLTLELPPGWKILTNENRINENSFNIKNAENAVFLVGKDWREKTIQIEKTNINYATAGAWSFSDEEATEMISSVFLEHKKFFGEARAVKPQIILLPFPQLNVSPDRWRAETRGATVTIISGKIQQKNAALQRLHEQLRHELFHLWLPNGVNLSGNYSWFYEGFTIYQALRTGVELNQIRFEDYLNTLSRAYDIVRNDATGKSFSLIEASQRRWAGSNNYVYARGLLAAFLCDVRLLRESKGKKSLKDIFQTVYSKHRFPAEIQDGNQAILSILNSYPELIPIIRNYVEGKAAVDWREDLESLGIEFQENSAATYLKVKDKPGGRQKDLLDKLGYNQWRKLLQKKK